MKPRGMSVESENDVLEEEIDPRIKDELDKMNRSTDEINLVETELTEWRVKYNASLSKATQQLQKIAKRNPKSIEKARNYYETQQDVAQAHLALQRSVSNFQRANGVYRASKETIDLAESRLREFDDKKVDMAWQEMLNIQMQRFTEADKDRRRSQALHEKAAKRFEYLEKKMQMLKKKNKNSVAKAKTYFELKGLLESDLQAKRQKVDELQRKVDASKRNYRESLCNLEQISSEIHEKRRKSITPTSYTDAMDGSMNNNPLNLNTVGLNTYDDIDELEAELDDFDLSENDDDNDGVELSSSESDSDTEREELKKTSSKPRPLKRSNTAPASGFKVAGNHPVSRKRPQAFKRNLSVTHELGKTEATTTAENGRHTPSSPMNFVETVSEASENLFSEEDADKNESTYTRLHGTNVDVESNKDRPTVKKSIHPPDDFDIFDDLCS